MNYTVERGEVDSTREFIVCPTHGVVALALNQEQADAFWKKHLRFVHKEAEF